ncbi:MAG: hypothetical protein H7Y43_04385 [Akkermansiaceae bacterium]|nr:hypothetical protein [Verrucomicrobiales bacterium]
MTGRIITFENVNLQDGRGSTRYPFTVAAATLDALRFNNCSILMNSNMANNGIFCGSGLVKDFTVTGNSVTGTNLNTFLVLGSLVTSNFVFAGNTLSGAGAMVPYSSSLSTRARVFVNDFGVVNSYGVNIGEGSSGNFYGAAIGYNANGASEGAAIGNGAVAQGQGNFAAGELATINTAWKHTVTLGTGAATAQGALHFRGTVLMDTNRVIFGNGSGLTNLMNDVATNIFSGTLFPLGTNTTISTSSSGGFSGIANVPSSTVRSGWVTVLGPAGGITWTNRSGWHPSDGVLTRTVTNCTFQVDVQPGLYTNLYIIHNPAL